jgi:phenylpyruvate tautomerase PptA (4-oxalocrotonate tautomerase family)
MPFLHLDLPPAVAVADRRRMAARLARLYAEVMETDPERVTVAFRESDVLRLGADGEVEPAVVIQCDIRRGRPPAQRERLGAAIAALLEDEIGWPPQRTIVEFTQHAGDEFWRAGGLSADWTPAPG